MCLISFESEVNNIRKQYEAQGFEVVIPKTNILAEFPVAWVDKNVQANGTEKAAKAYLNWLYSPQAQTIITDFYYRVNNPEVMDKLKDKFPQTELFRVEDQFWLLAGSDENPLRQRRRTGQTVGGGALSKCSQYRQDVCCPALP
ncbi:thiosulfate transporter subunit [Citrobacter koseri]|uniref:Thiosulfate transporter subunit n=1 Tax=Citrobacter koseri TaxID=545 RepID=A0A2X2XRP2_CITKO|nr:thiosulfate transporter subunit [Citrobacter koseri]